MVLSVLCFSPLYDNFFYEKFLFHCKQSPSDWEIRFLRNFSKKYWIGEELFVNILLTNEIVVNFHLNWTNVGEIHFDLILIDMLRSIFEHVYNRVIMFSFWGNGKNTCFSIHSTRPINLTINSCLKLYYVNKTTMVNYISVYTKRIQNKAGKIFHLFYKQHK